MPKVLLTVTRSDCRCGYCKAGDQFLVEDLCPPLFHELWHAAYPYVLALLNGADLDRGDARARCFDVSCPDAGRVCLHGKSMEDHP